MNWKGGISTTAAGAVMLVCAALAGPATVALTQNASEQGGQPSNAAAAAETPALAAYKRLGFRTIERFYLTRFELNT